MEKQLYVYAEGTWKIVKNVWKNVAGSWEKQTMPKNIDKERFVNSLENNLSAHGSFFLFNLNKK